MNKTKIIQFRVTDEQYNTMAAEANGYGINVNELARRKALYNCSSDTISPRVIITLAEMYRMFELPQENWNKEMHRNYKKGMSYLYDVFKDRK